MRPQRLWKLRLANKTSDSLTPYTALVCGVFIPDVLRPCFQTAQAGDGKLPLSRRAALGEVVPAAIAASFAAFLASARLAAGTLSGIRQG